MPKRAKQSFAYSEKDDSITVISEDDLYADDHPAVKARPDMFRDTSEDVVIEKPVRVKAEAKVEQATAAPGEKRDR